MSDYSDITPSPTFQHLTLDETFLKFPAVFEEKLAEGWSQRSELSLVVRDGRYRVRAHLRRIWQNGN